MKDNPILSVRGIGKRYKLGATLSHNTLRDKMAATVSSWFGAAKDSNDPVSRTARSEIWALKDISFSLKQGEMIWTADWYN